LAGYKREKEKKGGGGGESVGVSPPLVAIAEKRVQECGCLRKNDLREQDLREQGFAVADSLFRGKDGHRGTLSAKGVHWSIQNRPYGTTWKQVKEADDRKGTFYGMTQKSEKRVKKRGGWTHERFSGQRQTFEWKNAASK